VSGDRRIEIVRHLDEEELDRLLDEADDPKVTKRLTFVKRLYKGANLEDAADDVGKSASTGSRWARRWNEVGLGLLTPTFGAGMPDNLYPPISAHYHSVSCHAHNFRHSLIRSSERQILCMRRAANRRRSLALRGCHRRHPSSSRLSGDSNAKLLN
jgi:hypothetical protein